MWVMLAWEVVSLKGALYLHKPQLSSSGSLSVVVPLGVSFLPLGGGRFMHLVVLYDYQASDCDAEQLALTEQLFDAALGKLGVVAPRQLCLIVGDFFVSPPRFLVCPKESRLGSRVDLEAAWAGALGTQLAVRLGVIAGILWWTVL